MWSWLTFWRPPCLRRVVVIHLVHDDDIALRGVLWESRGQWFTLRNVSIKQGHADPKPNDDIVIHRSSIAFFSIVPQ